MTSIRSTLPRVNGSKVLLSKSESCILMRFLHKLITLFLYAVSSWHDHILEERVISHNFSTYINFDFRNRLDVTACLTRTNRRRPSWVLEFSRISTYHYFVMLANEYLKFGYVI